MWRNGQAWPLTHQCPAELGRWEQAVSKKGPKQQSLPQFICHMAEQIDASEEVLGPSYGVPKRASSQSGLAGPAEAWKSCQKKRDWSRVVSPWGFPAEVPFSLAMVCYGQRWSVGWLGGTVGLSSVPGEMGRSSSSRTPATGSIQCIYMEIHLWGWVEPGHSDHVYFIRGTTSHAKQPSVSWISDVSVGSGARVDVLLAVGIPWPPGSSCGAVSLHTLIPTHFEWCSAYWGLSTQGMYKAQASTRAAFWDGVSRTETWHLCKSRYLFCSSCLHWSFSSEHDESPLPEHGEIQRHRKVENSKLMKKRRFYMHAFR